MTALKTGVGSAADQASSLGNAGKTVSTMRKSMNINESTGLRQPRGPVLCRSTTEADHQRDSLHREARASHQTGSIRDQ